MKGTRILVAGIGNIFFGDDAFGVAVVGRLLARPQPAGVRIEDFGIRGVDLAFALEGCDAAVLIDAAARGGAPGTLYVLETAVGAGVPEELGAHGMTPDRALRWLRPGVGPRWVRVVGCEPGSLGGEDGEMGLSGAVLAAVEEAVRVVEGLVRGLLVREEGEGGDA